MTDKTDSPRSRLFAACFDKPGDASEHGETLRIAAHTSPLRTLEEQQELDDDERFKASVDSRLSQHVAPAFGFAEQPLRMARHAEMFRSLQAVDAVTPARAIDWETQDAITPAQRNANPPLFLPSMTLHQAAQVLRRFSDDKRAACLLVEQTNGAPVFRMIYEDPKSPVPAYLKVTP